MGRGARGSLGSGPVAGGIRSHWSLSAWAVPQRFLHLSPAGNWTRTRSAASRMGLSAPCGGWRSCKWPGASWSLQPTSPMRGEVVPGCSPLRDILSVPSLPVPKEGLSRGWVPLLQSCAAGPDPAPGLQLAAAGCGGKKPGKGSKPCPGSLGCPHPSPLHPSTLCWGVGG